MFDTMTLKERYQLYRKFHGPFVSGTMAVKSEYFFCSRHRGRNYLWGAPMNAATKTLFDDEQTCSQALHYLSALQYACHQENLRWWQDASGNRIERNKGELLALIHSEISEAMEGERKNLMDDKLPHRKMAEVELADALIRIFDYAEAFGYNVAGALMQKVNFNRSRADHKHEAREAANGKKW